MAQRTVSNEQKSEIIKMYETGTSANLIAKHFDFSAPTILRILRLANIEIINKAKEKQKTQLTIQDELNLCNDYISLISLAKLEDKYNIGWRRVEKILNKHNIPRNSPLAYPNPMKGTHFYQKWIEKYGQTVADTKFIKTKEKFSQSSSGEKNPMYNKPSPKGCGVGWKGWYKDFYFRSLRELSYLLELDRQKIKWETAEQKCLIIHYIDYKNTKRTYRPDFLVNDKLLVEIKPKRLQKSLSVLAKKEAAEIFCKEKGLTYVLIDVPINAEQIKIALLNGLVKFSRDYEKRFFEYLDKEKL